MIHWREKLIAAGVHFGVTLVLAGIAAALIFLVWFPDPYQTMIGGTELFLLIVGSDLALGPLMSLVIYDSRKSRRELLTDYTIVGAIQIAALVYGVIVMSGTRPVYAVFNTDRYEIVTARDIDDQELAAATDPQYRKLPWTGPKLISVVVPAADQQDALFESLQGNEEHQRPKFYAPLESRLEAIRARSKTLAALEAKKPGAKPAIDQAIAASGTPPDRLRWLPVRHRNGFWTVLIDTIDGKPVAWVAVDPYD
jgi:hypothetical protein